MPAAWGLDSVAGASAIAMSLALITSSCGQAPPALVPPDVVWSINVEDDTLFQIPDGVSADPTHQRVFVADVRGATVLVLDARTGAHLGTVGGSGDGPGEFRSPVLTASAPDGSLLGVFDFRSVQIFDARLRFVRRIPVGTLVFYPKGMALGTDTTVVLTGGAGPPDAVRGVHWLVRDADSLMSTGPRPPDEPAGLFGQAAQLVAGGPVLWTAHGALVADAATGDVWLSSPTGARLVARGPEAVPGLMGRMVFVERIEGRPMRSFWWTFTRAVLLDTLPDGHFLIGVSVQDSAMVRFYEEGPGTAPRLLGGWRDLAVQQAVPFDSKSCLVLTRRFDSGRGRAETEIARVRYPFTR
jgi:hypothetical protein